MVIAGDRIMGRHPDPPSWPNPPIDLHGEAAHIHFHFLAHPPSRFRAPDATARQLRAFAIRHPPHLAFGPRRP
jgi:hypothetical protein